MRYLVLLGLMNEPVSDFIYTCVISNCNVFHHKERKIHPFLYLFSSFRPNDVGPLACPIEEGLARASPPLLY